MKNKITIVSFLVILIIFMLNLTSNAADTTFKIKIDASEDEVNYGDNVSFTISLSDLQKGDSIGTNAIKAKIQYDSSLLEYTGYKTENNWNLISLNKENMTFAMTNGEYILQDQALVTFSFKVKRRNKR